MRSERESTFDEPAGHDCFAETRKALSCLLNKQDARRVRAEREQVAELSLQAHSTTLRKDCSGCRERLVLGVVLTRPTFSPRSE